MYAKLFTLLPNNFLKHGNYHRPTSPPEYVPFLTLSLRLTSPVLVLFKFGMNDFYAIHWGEGVQDNLA